MRIFKPKAKKGGSIHQKLQWLNITPGEGHFAFGYYDRNPFSHDNRYHLAIKFDQQKRIPKPGEKATVGIIRLETKKFIPIAETEAWCHQQGSMTQWLPQKPEQFIFNDFINEDMGKWAPISRVYDIKGNHIRDYDYPVYIISPDGKYAATLNFSRIPRRGYSYARAPLPQDKNLPDVEQEGLYLLDLETGDRQLVLNYKTILNHPRGTGQKSSNLSQSSQSYYHWMNHISFNVDGTRMMLLHRYQRPLGKWKTDLWSCKLDGSDVMCSFSHKWWSKWGVSHQLWGRTPREILVDGKLKWYSYPKYWVFNELTGPEEPTLISKGTHYSGHLNFSPDFRWILGDTYPHYCTQYLNLTNVATQNAYNIGRFYHSSKQKGDYRCDLHPRWSDNGRFISVDSIHKGERNIFILDFEFKLTRSLISK